MLLELPATAFFLLLFLVPVGTMMMFSVFQQTRTGDIGTTLTLAATLLSHAAPDAIRWNGGRGGGIGIGSDRRLRERITEVAGRPSTTSTLAILEAFAARVERRFGLVTYWRATYQKAAAVDVWFTRWVGSGR